MAEARSDRSLTSDWLSSVRQSTQRTSRTDGTISFNYWFADYQKRRVEYPALVPRLDSTSSGARMHARGTFPAIGHKPICIVTDDFRFAYDISRRFHALKLHFYQVADDAAVPRGTGIVVKKGRTGVTVHGGRFIISGSAEECSAKAWLIHSGLINWKIRVIIGIDPGERPGIAIYSGEERIAVTGASSPEDVARFTRTISSMVGVSRVLVRIGNGDPTNRNRIIRSVWPTCSSVEVVDEKSTSRIARSDGEAAAIIARTSGVALTEPPELTPTDGEIRNIQRRSRLNSGGLTTISRTIAKAVATGEYTLDEAIRRQQSSDRKKKSE